MDSDTESDTEPPENSDVEPDVDIPEDGSEEPDIEDIPAEDILFEDDFSSTRNNWYTGVDEDELGTYEAQIEDGVYRVYMNAVSDGGNFGWVEPDPIDVDDFVLSVDVPVAEFNGIFSYGVIFRSTPDGEAYMFEVDDYGILVVYMPVEGDWVELVEYTEAPAINPDGPNQIEVEALGPELTFFINGEEVAYVEDDRIKSGSVGLVVELYEPDSELNVEFDNFVVSEP